MERLVATFGEVIKAAVKPAGESAIAGALAKAIPKVCTSTALVAYNSAPGISAEACAAWAEPNSLYKTALTGVVQRASDDSAAAPHNATLPPGGALLKSSAGVKALAAGERPCSLSEEEQRAHKALAHVWLFDQATIKAIGVLRSSTSAADELAGAARSAALAACGVFLKVFGPTMLLAGSGKGCSGGYMRSSAEALVNIQKVKAIKPATTPADDEAEVNASNILSHEEVRQRKKPKKLEVGASERGAVRRRSASKRKRKSQQAGQADPVAEFDDESVPKAVVVCRMCPDKGVLEYLADWGEEYGVAASLMDAVEQGDANSPGPRYSWVDKTSESEANWPSVFAGPLRSGQGPTRCCRRSVV